MLKISPHIRHLKQYISLLCRFISIALITSCLTPEQSWLKFGWLWTDVPSGSCTGWSTGSSLTECPVISSDNGISSSLAYPLKEVLAHLPFLKDRNKEKNRDCWTNSQSILEKDIIIIIVYLQWNRNFWKFENQPSPGDVLGWPSISGSNLFSSVNKNS